MSDRVMQVFRYCEAHVRAFDPDLVVSAPLPLRNRLVGHTPTHSLSRGRDPTARM